MCADATRAGRHGVEAPAASPEGIRVVIVDRHAEACLGLSFYLSSQPGLCVSGCCSSAEEAQDWLRGNSVDVILLDVTLTGGRSSVLLQAMLSERPESRILLMSPSLRQEHIERALEMAAHGLICKDACVTDLPNAIRELAAGGCYFCREIRDRLIVDQEGLRLSERDAHPGLP